MNTFGRLFRITTWGESHGVAVGVVIDGCPAGLRLTEKEIQHELNRRRPGASKIVSARNESDHPSILSGVFKGVTLGTPLSVMVKNVDARSEHYKKLKNVYRPGHADYTWDAKFGIRDWRGGGRASARETVGRVIGGAVAKKILSRVGIEIAGYVSQVGDIVLDDVEYSTKYSKGKKSLYQLQKKVKKNMIRCPDPNKAKEMIARIEQVRKDGDSIGGVVALIAIGVPAGLGSPVFGKLSAELMGALGSIPAVKGVSIGSGFDCATMQGSEHNDVLTTDGITERERKGKGKSGKEKKEVNSQSEPLFIKTKTNHAGGIVGGISNGMPIMARIAIKPASSISQEQETVDTKGKKKNIRVMGRHDPCLCPRAVPIAESMMALVLVDHWLMQKACVIK